MHIYLTARHLDLTPDLRDHVERRIVQPLRDHHADEELVRLEIQLVHEDNRDSRMACHVLAELKGGGDINVREHAGDAESAIDLVHDRLLPLVAERRDKLLTQRRQAGRPS